MVQYVNYAGLLTSLPVIEEVIDAHTLELEEVEEYEHRGSEAHRWARNSRSTLGS